VSNPFLKKGSGFERGFEHYFHLPTGDRAVTVGQNLIGIEHVDSPLLQDESAASVKGVAARLLSAMRHDPFFLWVHLIDPHLPYSPHTDSLRAIIDVNEWHFLTESLMLDIRTGRRALTSTQKKVLKSLYLDEIRFADRMIGKILHTLRSLALEDEVTIIVTSDHGEEFWDHGGFEHGHTLYDELIMVPLIVKPIGLEKPRRIPDLVTTASIAPTICELFGDSSKLGQLPSLVPYWTQAASQIKPLEHVISEAMLYFGPGRAVYAERYKFIDWQGTEKRMLFDLRADPKESFSLSLTDQPMVQEAESVLSSNAPCSDEITPLDGGDVMSESERERLRVLGYLE
jgi:arylsulfatase A-like enzyme